MHSESEREPGDRIVVDPAAVATRLADLGLGAGTLATAMLRALGDAFTTTRHDPPSMRGYLAWGKTVRYLRDTLVPLGWASDDTGNYSIVVHPAGGMAIAVVAGDSDTGLEAGSPTTAHPKGPLTGRAVIDNQRSFADIASFPGAPSIRQTWILLFYVDEETGEVRMELSLPTSMSISGRVYAWIERIILPTEALGLPAEVAETAPPTGVDSEDFDVPVARRPR